MFLACLEPTRVVMPDATPSTGGRPAIDIVNGALVAVGVAAATGLNAPLPLLLLGALDRWTDIVELGSPWDALADPVWLAVLAGVTLLDLVGDKVPAVDHVLHAVGLITAPAAGALAAMAGSSGSDLAPVVAATAGAIVAEGAHVTRAGVRPMSTVATGGLGNPILSLLEDVTSATLTVLAVVVPVLAIVVLVVVAVIASRALRRARRRLGPRAAHPDG
jgi:hypothetical protein